MRDHWCLLATSLAKSRLNPRASKFLSQRNKADSSRGSHPVSSYVFHVLMYRYKYLLTCVHHTPEMTVSESTYKYYIFKIAFDVMFQFEENLTIDRYISMQADRQINGWIDRYWAENVKFKRLGVELDMNHCGLFILLSDSSYYSCAFWIRVITLCHSVTLDGMEGEQHQVLATWAFCDAKGRTRAN